MSTAVRDSIEKTTVIKAPPARVWRALSDPAEFGTWFRMRLDGTFAEGETVRGHVLHPGYEHVSFDMMIVRVEPERYFAYRWHPYAVDMTADYSSEPTTLVEFRLEPAGADTRLTVVESGFDRIPLARRAEAFRMNEGGWTEQVKNIAGHVTAA